MGRRLDLPELVPLPPAGCATSTRCSDLAAGKRTTELTFVAFDVTFCGVIVAGSIDASCLGLCED